MSANHTAFKKACDEAAGALDVAEQAIMASKRALRERPPVTLVKVASDTCHRVAAELHATGVFQMPVEKLAQQLYQADKPGLIAILEKLASKAVFVPDDLGKGVLVPKPERRKVGLSGVDAIYAAASEEVDGR